MLKIVFYLVYIFWRKYFVKGDYLALSLIFIGLSFSLAGIYKNYADYYFLLFLFPLGMLFHHWGRNDFPLLKTHRHWRGLIFGEYVINNVPILLIFSVKQDFLWAVLTVLFLGFCACLPQKSFKMAYPFSVFDPLWHTAFRKYKLILGLPVSLFLVAIAKAYNNENIAVFALIFNALLCCVPYFEREHQAHIGISFFKGKAYLHQHIRVSFQNYLWVSLLPILLATVLFSWELLVYGLLFYGIVLVSLLTKYAFFENPVSQSIVFVLIASGFTYGIPFLALPVLYIQALKKINFVGNNLNTKKNNTSSK